MKTGFAMLVGVGMLSLAVGVGSADAATRHYSSHRHAAKSHALAAPAMRADVNELTTSGNNPAKKYPTRQIGENAGLDTIRHDDEDRVPLARTSARIAARACDSR